MPGRCVKRVGWCRSGVGTESEAVETVKTEIGVVVFNRE